MKKIFSTLLFVSIFCLSLQAQLGKCKGKYLGNIIAYSVPSNYTTLWNQTTSENGSKWGSCDKGNGVYDFSNSDLSYNTAKNSGGAFKFHTLTWGGQAPGYLKTATAAEIVVAIRKWYQAVYDHYAPMGGLKIIDVLNEPVNTPLTAELPNLKAALTLGYQSEAANANDLNNPYGYAIWPYQLARKLFPNTVLLINEYNVEFNWNNCRATYIAMSNAIKNAPNLTDGKKNLIDGIGLQAHGMNGATNNLSAANFKACLDEIWTKTGLPIHMTELDIVADPNEAAQKTKYQEFFTIAWEHPHVAGITLWGYIQGSTWIPGNKVTGPGGTDTGLQYPSSYTTNPGGDRPAMTWLKQYMAAQTSLACCPAPAPFANCINGALPTVSITAPTSPATYTAPAAITLTATAADADGTITKVEFYNGTTLLSSKTASPYTYSWANVVAGKYSIVAKATDNSGNVTVSDTVSIKVNVAQKPYGGTAWAIPGTIQFESYDDGGNGFAYNDASAGNTGGATIRTDEDVDIENCTDVGTGYNIGFGTAGEWLEYTVNAATAGKYNLVLRVACSGDGRTISLSSNGTAIATDIAIPNTTGWQTWVDVKTTVTLSAGVQVIRLTIGATDYVNLNYMTFSAVGPTIKLTTPTTGSSFTTSQTVSLAATATVAGSAITNVKFYALTNLLATDNTAPYTFDWTGMTAGSYKIVAEATDANGLKGTDTISVTITQALMVVKLKAGWNLVGCPIDGITDISKALSSIWTNVVTVKNFDAFYDASITPALNSLKTVEWGKGYFVKVNANCDLDWIVK